MARRALSFGRTDRGRRAAMVLLIIETRVQSGMVKLPGWEATAGLRPTRNLRLCGCSCSCYHCYNDFICRPAPIRHHCSTVHLTSAVTAVTACGGGGGGDGGDGVWLVPPPDSEDFCLTLGPRSQPPRACQTHATVPPFPSLQLRFPCRRRSPAVPRRCQPPQKRRL